MLDHRIKLEQSYSTDEQLIKTYHEKRMDLRLISAQTPVEKNYGNRSGSCPGNFPMRVNSIKSYLVWFCNLAFTEAWEILLRWFFLFDFCILGFGFPILKLDSQTICLKIEITKFFFWKSRIFPNSTSFVSIICWIYNSYEYKKSIL